MASSLRDNYGDIVYQSTLVQQLSEHMLARSLLYTFTTSESLGVAASITVAIGNPETPCGVVLSSVSFDGTELTMTMLDAATVTGGAPMTLTQIDRTRSPVATTPATATRDGLLGGETVITDPLLLIGSTGSGNSLVSSQLNSNTPILIRQARALVFQLENTSAAVQDVSLSGYLFADTRS